MKSLRTLAIVYELGEMNMFKNLLEKFSYMDYCFIPIIINPKIEQSYTISKREDEFTITLLAKLEEAQEIYIINPKGKIVIHLNQILAYAKEKDKPVTFMYNYCYQDCKYHSAKLHTMACSRPQEIYTIPSNVKLLPACEYYARIYNDWIVESKTQLPYEASGSEVPDDSGVLPEDGGETVREATEAPKD